jgi:hypothetical protein
VEFVAVIERLVGQLLEEFIQFVNPLLQIDEETGRRDTYVINREVPEGPDPDIISTAAENIRRKVEGFAGGDSTRF